MTTLDVARPITGGVDTHLDVNVAAAIDHIGGFLGVESFITTPEGNAELLGWLLEFGPIDKVGIEGTSSYGTSLARYLRKEGISVVEVDRPNRQERRRTGKSDTTDAIEAARAALSGRAQGAGKAKDGKVEAIRALLIVRRSAKETKIKTLNQIRHLGFTAPEEIRARLRPCSRHTIAGVAASFRPRKESDPVTFATKTALRALGERVQVLDEEKGRIDVLLCGLVNDVGSDLLSLYGVGPETAAMLLVAAGDNPERVRTEPAWAKLCGAAPKPADSGKVSGHMRLDSGGDRQANSALHGIVLTRMRHDPRTQAYVERRVKDGLTKRDVIRVLKRYVAREVYHRLPRP